jgi:predicted AlkP superfamily pyrophosphatase or phosphodiesterase
VLKIVKPNYKDGSIVNLMASILRAYGCRSEYTPLPWLRPDELRQYKNIVLMVLDGLGYEYLCMHKKGSFLFSHIRDKMTSVFPATTASAITTFLTGVAPQQHGITGWFMYLKELGVATTILPFTPRYGGPSFGTKVINPRVIFDYQPIFDRVKAKAYYLCYQDYVDSDYTRAFSGKALRLEYRDLRSYFKRITDLVVDEKNDKLVYAYWPNLDTLIHMHGTRSTQATGHLKELEKGIEQLVKKTKGTNTIILITADHGLVDSDDAHTIKVQDHPEFLQTLTVPVCGEPRVAYCYVHPARVQQFKDYVRDKFHDKCELHKADDLIKQNYFGLHAPHPRLFDRIGDYVLSMKGNYVMRDFVLGERVFFLTGHHGGLSPDEMLVPLIVLTV